MENNEMNENNEIVVKQKSNKGVIILIVILILMVLGLSGYLVYDKFMGKEETPVTNETTNNNTQTDNSNKKVLKKDESKDVVYTEISTDLHKVPQVNINSESANRINQSIISFYDEFKKGDGLAGPYTSYAFDYKYYVDGDIVSVIVSHSEESGSIHPTKVYNINQYSGEEVTKTDILKYLNISESEYTSKIVESYKLADPLNIKDLDAIPNEVMRENETKIYNEIQESNIKKLSENDIIGIYIDNKQLYVVFVMNTVVGAGRSEVILDVNNNQINHIN